MTQTSLRAADTLLTPPTFSVVVAAVNGFAPLAGCLDAIERAQPAKRAEVIVVDRCGIADRIVAGYPGVTLIPVAPGATIPQMRSTGILASRGDWVIVTEDHCEPHADWFDRFAAATTGPWDVIAGAVENGRRDRIVDWAAFFTEYSEYVAPRAGGENTDLPGMNTAYRRSALNAVPGLIESAVWETFLHGRLRDAGSRLYSASDVLLDHCKSFGFWEFLSQRYYLARSFAGMRVRGAPFVRRAFYGLTAPALIAILPARIVRRVRARRRYDRELAHSFPLLMIFLASWTVGEIVGYWFGEGDASGKVE